ncbi:phosphoheptose isomerase [Candidatus Woesearchaeota archaeon]|nr:MAG: phosphoheptose isomerase [Candidatus Woesearchaeota archaeon]
MNDVASLIEDSIEVKKRLLQDEKLVEKINVACDKILDCYSKGGKVIFMGNGGSAADAQHLSTEFISKFLLERGSLASIALNCNTSTLTAIGNDYGFDYVFSRQIEGLANENDVVFGISTSGNSANILEALKKSKEKGCYFIGLTGEKGGAMKEGVDLLLNVPSDHTPRIQEAHIMIGHIICEIVERRMFR